MQLPEVEAAFVAARPADGAIRALVGGFDFNRNKFNHVTQAWRQPGSASSPSSIPRRWRRASPPATVVNDAPIAIDAERHRRPALGAEELRRQVRRPDAPAHGARQVEEHGVDPDPAGDRPQYAQDYITRFGFDAERHPPYLTMALGAGSVTAWQMARAYAVFANGGYRVQPYFIHRIVDDRGNPLGVGAARSARATRALRVIDARNAFIMDSLMQDVTRVGTGARAASLGRKDLAGKTGTTNEFIDAWFAGYNPALVGVAWVGFDQPKTLGANETGGLVALPIWMSYMGRVLKGIPEAQQTVPEGVISVRIDPETGLQAGDGKLAEYFYREFLPADQPATATAEQAGARSPEEVRSQLF